LYGVNLYFLDYLIIAAYFVFSIGIALYYSKRAGKNTDEFFLSGRNIKPMLNDVSFNSSERIFS